MARYTVFYGTQLYGEYTDLKSIYPLPDEVYQGGYLYDAQPYTPNGEVHWMRLDRTPVLIEDVPKELRAFALILNL